MCPSQEPHEQAKTIELDPRMRHHLETQLAELTARQDMLAKRIVAIDADMLRPCGDGEQELALQERRIDMVANRDHIASLSADGELRDTRQS